MNVLLVSPTGKNAIIMSNAGGSEEFAVHDVNLTIDDEAPNVLPAGDQIVSGAYRPANYQQSDPLFPSPAPRPSGNAALSVFDRSNPTGTWKLYVFDDTSEDGGSFANGWALQIKAKVPR